MIVYKKKPKGVEFYDKKDVSVGTMFDNGGYICDICGSGFGK